MKASHVSIRYYSGTGNSQRLANVCAQELGQAGISSDLASVTDDRAPKTGALGIFLAPVHGLGLPRSFSAYLRNLKAQGQAAMLIVTGGSPDNSGWAVPDGIELLSRAGYDARYGELVQMPENWIPFHNPPEPETSQAIRARGEDKTRACVRDFLAGARFIHPLNLARFGKLGSRLMKAGYGRKGAYRLWKLFKVSPACSGCGLCAQACPFKAIAMAEGKPRWSEACEQCMRCVNLCPKHAIHQLEGLLRGSRNRQYLEPHFKPLADAE